MIQRIHGEDKAPLILVVDDNTFNARLLSRALQKKYFHTVLASNGREAIQQAREQRPALILMDMQMPEMDGFEAMQWLRHDPRLANIPIIALTGMMAPGDREMCLEAGADDYLSKPARLNDLLAMIMVYLPVQPRWDMQPSGGRPLVAS